MILLVDAGNTRVKWMMSTGAEPTEEDGPRGAVRVADLAALRRVWAGNPVRRALVACVAGDATRVALADLFAEMALEVHWLRAEPSGHGLVNAYRPPESLGVDRYAALIGALRRFGRDCVVVSVGTALTADMLTGDGEFLGGCIAPGPDLMRDALLRGTARVGSVAGEWRDFPLDTGSAVESGIALALLGVVRGMRERLVGFRVSGRAASGMPAGHAAGQLPRVLLTGGARACLRPLLDGEVFEVDDLVIEGLAWIARDLGYAG